MAIVRASEQEAIDVLVVGNAGMTGRKEFLLGNIPNRISHNARCVVVIVNTSPVGDRTPGETPTVMRSTGPAPSEPRLMARGAQIAAVMSKHGLRELFGRPDEQGTTGHRRLRFSRGMSSARYQAHWAASQRYALSCRTTCPTAGNRK
jgi:ubiquinone biosynthesis protein